MITILHRVDWGIMSTVLHGCMPKSLYNYIGGGGILGTPKSDYVIHVRLLTAKSYLIFVNFGTPLHYLDLEILNKIIGPV